MARYKKQECAYCGALTKQRSYVYAGKRWPACCAREACIDQWRGKEVVKRKLSKKLKKRLRRRKSSTKTWRKGTLHRLTKTPAGKKISTAALKRLAKGTGVNAKRAVKLLNLRGVKTGKRVA